MSASFLSGVVVPEPRRSVFDGLPEVPFAKLVANFTRERADPPSVQNFQTTTECRHLLGKVF